MEAFICFVFAVLAGILSAFGLYCFYVDLFVPIFHLATIRFGQFYFIAVVFEILVNSKRDLQNQSMKDIAVSVMAKCLVIWTFYGLYVWLVR